jgi:hypothetical protein
VRRILSRDAVSGQIGASGLGAAIGWGEFDALVRAESAMRRPLVHGLGLRLDG